MKLTSIASSSSGNCTLIQGETTDILIDAGVSCKKICEGLTSLNSGIDRISAIFITHEHSDHTNGLKIISKKYHIPIYGTADTLKEIARSDSKNEIDSILYHAIEPDRPILINELEILAFRNSHDAADPVGYRINSGCRSVAVATDLGHYTDYTVEHLKNVNALLIESNHDIHMLEVGPYTYALKRRILSDKGHLSNDSCGELVCRIAHDELKGILLGHLSKENNFPQMALATMENVLQEKECSMRSVRFEVLSRSERSQMFYI